MTASSEVHAAAYVGTGWLARGPIRQVDDPSGGPTVGSIVTVDSADVDHAAAVAEDAGRSWRAVPPAERAVVLAAAGNVLQGRSVEIADVLRCEGGRPRREAEAEVAKAVKTFRYYAGLVGALDGRSFAGSGGVRHETRREPVGVAAAITPWNVPAASPARKLAPALLAGNAVLLKPASATPLTAWHLVRALYDAGLPQGLVQFLPGAGSTVGEAVATNRRVGAVSFTGSTEVGLALQTSLSGTLTKLQLELGGKNGAIVMPDADLDRATQLIVQAAFAAAGQQCTATSRVIVHAAVADAVTDLIVERAEALTVSDTADEATQMGPLIDERQLSTTDGYVRRAVEAGAVIATGGHRLDRPGSYYAPTVLTRVDRSSEIAMREVFGPVLSIMVARDVDDAIDVLNGTAYGLSSAVHTRDIRIAQRVAERADCGVVAVGGATAGIELAAPFGGFKSSGTTSKEHGPESMEFFTRTKLISWY
ncbi:aldehyde dehydrogenase family protein [Rathayibacter soli]|uniref:aldehyde dehydrogenase family protein n=1 Tax=Rathayibacter soli TaxID=3144168 RepID=UPI0027E464F3|nr:aldehyde dehydrogenase family protein [Glaciibacter superstes]